MASNNYTVKFKRSLKATKDTTWMLANAIIQSNKNLNKDCLKM